MRKMVARRAQTGGTGGAGRSRGARKSVTMGNTTNSFLRDGAYVTDPVLVDSGAVYTPGISERRGTKTTYLHSGLKNAFAQSDTGQSVAATREYDAFGNVTSHTGAWEGPLGYAGKFGYQSASIPGTSTPDAGLQLLGHRYYDPSTGRFLTRDPIFDGRNWYAYGSGEANPITGVDPDGRLVWIIVGGVVLAGVIIWGLLELEKFKKDGKERIDGLNDLNSDPLDAGPNIPAASGDEAPSGSGTPTLGNPSGNPGVGINSDTTSGLAEGVSGLYENIYQDLLEGLISPPKSLWDAVFPLIDTAYDKIMEQLNREYLPVIRPSMPFDHLEGL